SPAISLSFLPVDPGSGANSAEAQVWGGTEQKWSQPAAAASRLEPATADLQKLQARPAKDEGLSGENLSWITGPSAAHGSGALLCGLVAAALRRPSGHYLGHVRTNPGGRG